MTPSVDHTTGQLFAEDPLPEPSSSHEKKVFKPYNQKILWNLVYRMAFFQVSAIIGVYLAFTSTKWQTLLFGENYSFLYKRN